MSNLCQHRARRWHRDSRARASSAMDLLNEDAPDRGYAPDVPTHQAMDVYASGSVRPSVEADQRVTAPRRPIFRARDYLSVWHDSSQLTRLSTRPYPGDLCGYPASQRAGWTSGKGRA